MKTKRDIISMTEATVGALTNSLKAEGYEFEGQSYLFWEYMRLLNEVKPKYFLLENVVMGEKWQKILTRAIGINPIQINSALVSAQNRNRLYWTNIYAQPDGLFGHMFCKIPQPKDKMLFLRDILQDNVDEKYILSKKFVDWLERHSIKRGVEVKKRDGTEKSGTLTATATGKGNLSSDWIIVASCGRDPENKSNRKKGLNTVQTLEPRNDGKTNCLTSVSKDNLVLQLNPSTESNGCQPYQQNRVYSDQGISPALMAQMSSGTHAIKQNQTIRRLTPIECERLQTVKDNYTSIVSDTQRYKMLGNGWTVDVIAHIFSYINK